MRGDSRDSFDYSKGVQEICAEAGIKPQAVKLPFLFDVVDNATLEEDDELQDRWANLLSNAADPNYNGLISTAFPDILRQISKDEALFLEDMHKRDNSRHPAEEFAELVKFLLKNSRVIIRYVYEDNVRRFGVIEQIDFEKEPHRAAYSTTLSGFQEPRKWKLTAFGIAFIDACTTPKKGKTGKTKKNPK